MNNVRKVAIFLFLIGLDKGRKIMDLMDSGELKQVLREMKTVQAVSETEGEFVRNLFLELGYEAKTSPVDTMFFIRQVLHEDH
ncbi:MAG: hypothetical protein E6713_08625 [Sporomusaceae bacterium]|nr:hypothetical protein [Sporomusaceae bacterium]